MAIEDVQEQKLGIPLWAGAWKFNPTHTTFDDRFWAV